MPLAEVAGNVTAPPGFHATLFAGEPDVRQPIAMAFDDRGRLWVVENYTYTGIGNDAFDTNRRDRILIFEDSKGTGHFDKRTVFWDQGVRLTGIALGFGGVFCTGAPYLLFIPDRNGGDIPDGSPEILLDGWNDDQMHHTIVNGPKWGPDGWLYGRQGIAANSSVGRPGTPEKDRIKLNCAIWRYHPTRKIFEVVCQGGTNPWGHDWDQYGELFFVNTVIGHLWHGIPGAFYKRMFGEHLAPYRYGLIDQTADHYHWNTGKSWTAARGGGDSDALGGGHAHSGLMIYMGDNWPDQYYGNIFMLNFHGRRINQDLPERKGSGYVARHGADLVKFGDPWFQGIDLDYGPDGGVSVLDWSDTGECHGSDGVHRETGRIYKLTYEGTNRVVSNQGPAPLSLLTNSLANLSNGELLRLQMHPNEWYARHARRILQERALSIPASFREEILSLYSAQTNIALKLRLLFTLHAVGGDSNDWLKAQLTDSDEHVRSWAVRWLGEAPEVDWNELSPLFVRLAIRDPSPVVRLYLASALQRTPENLREPLAGALLEHAEDVADHNLPLMLWYGIEPMVAQYPDGAIRLAVRSRIPLVRQYISRRLGEEISKDPKSMDNLLSAAGAAGEGAQCDILLGLAEALQGRSAIPKPRAWDPLVRFSLEKSANKELLGLARQIGVVFGDSWAMQQLAQIVLDPVAPADDRRAALRQLIDARPANLPHVLEQALKDPVTTGIAAHGLLLLGDPNIAAWALQQWSTIEPDDRSVLVGLMVSRASTAALLLEAVASGVVPRSALNAFHARQIGNFNDPALNARLAQVWGEVHSSAADKLQLIARYQALLTPERLKQAKLSRGREMFGHTCAVCHKLYGEGASVGPDLTGSGRANLGYLLENIVDPSAIVPVDYRVSEVELKDGRDLTALVVAQTDHSLTFQTPTEKFTVERNEIVNVRQTKISLMPEGLLQGMKDGEICNLIAYLMAPNQVPLPPVAAE